MSSSRLLRPSLKPHDKRRRQSPSCSPFMPTRSASDTWQVSRGRAGLSMLLTELATKELEMMKEAVPQARRIGILWNPTTPSHLTALKAIEAAGERLGVQLRMVPARTLEEFDSAFSTMTQEMVSSFLVVASPLFVAPT